MTCIRVHLVDGTYELFRHFFALPSRADPEGVEVAATVGVLGSVLNLLAEGATHIGVATDHVIESFRNDLWPGYKTGAGIDPALAGQFGRLEEALAAMGVVVWPMVEREADDALASAAAVASADERVGQVLVCTPDKDLAQCVVGTRVVQFDRRKRMVMDEDAVRARFGVAPASIPDFLALVGDSADGFPGLPGFGPKTAAALLARYGHLQTIPDSAADWDVTLRGATALAATLASQRPLAMRFLDLATLRIDPPVLDEIDALRWTGPTDAFEAVAAGLGASRLADRAATVARHR